MMTKKNVPPPKSRIVVKRTSSGPKEALVIELTSKHRDFIAEALTALRSLEGKRALKTFLYQQVDERPGMVMPGRIQPMTPAALYDQFEKVAEKRSKGNRHALIKLE